MDPFSLFMIATAIISATSSITSAVGESHQIDAEEQQSEFDTYQKLNENTVKQTQQLQQADKTYQNNLAIFAAHGTALDSGSNRAINEDVMTNTFQNVNYLDSQNKAINAANKATLKNLQSEKTGLYINTGLQLVGDAAMAALGAHGLMGGAPAGAGKAASTLGNMASQGAKDGNVLNTMMSSTSSSLGNAQSGLQGLGGTGWF